MVVVEDLEDDFDVGEVGENYIDVVDVVQDVIVVIELPKDKFVIVDLAQDDADEASEVDDVRVLG